MRLGLVRNVGLHITALAVLALGACNDNPLDFDVKETTGIQVNPSSMVVAAGRTADLESRAVNQSGEPTFDAVSFEIDASCGAGAITVVPDPDQLEIQPPGLFVVTGGAVLGQSCINLTSGSSTALVEVTVVGDAIEITSPIADQVFRAGESGQIIAQLVDFDGNPVGPYEPEDAVFTSSDDAVALITDDVGNFTTDQSGTATLGATWLGQADNGTSGLGVIRTDQVTIEVIPSLPDTAYFTAGDDLGVLPVDEVVDFDVFVADALGNRNTIPDEIISVTAVSSDATVASVVPRIATDDAAFGQGDIPVVEVTTLLAGAVTISGTVTTSEGDFDFAGTLLIPNPIITAVTPATGTFAETVTITGSDFAPISKVYVGGYLLGNYTIDSPTQITAQMPTYSALPGPLDVVVSVAGVESPVGPTWEQTTAFVVALTEDNAVGVSGNDAPISVPAFITGTMIGEAIDGVTGQQADWFFFAISGTGTRTIDITQTPLIPTNDALIQVIDGGFNFFWCTIDNTGAPNPDGGECDLPGAGEELDPGVFSTGTWWVIPQDWQEVPVVDPIEYDLEIIMVED